MTLLCTSGSWLWTNNLRACVDPSLILQPQLVETGRYRTGKSSWGWEVFKQRNGGYPQLSALCRPCQVPHTSKHSKVSLNHFYSLPFIYSFMSIGIVYLRVPWSAHRKDKGAVSLSQWHWSDSLPTTLSSLKGIRGSVADGAGLERYNYICILQPKYWITAIPSGGFFGKCGSFYNRTQ